LCFVIVSVNGQWSYIDHDYEFRAAGVSFYNDTAGWMAGMKYFGYDPLLLHTTDGGKTYNNDPYISAPHGGFVTVDFEDENHGLAAGLMFFGLSPCAVMTTNGQNWTTVKGGREFICTSQSTEVLSSGQGYAMAAQWMELFDLQGDGLQISTDGGQTWNSRNWNQGTEARYLSCVTPTTCFVAGGTWAFPTSPENREFLRRRKNGEHVPHYYLNHHTKIESDGEFVEILDYEFPTTPGPIEKTNLTEFKAIVAMTTDGGKSWELLLNASGLGLYFNQISCPDADHCWVVGSGVVGEYNSTRAAWIYATSDGGQTWTQQLHWNGFSLIDIHMVDTSFGWAAGTQMLTKTDWQGVFLLTTDGGQTWTPNGSIHKFSPLNLSVVDTNYAYAAGFSTPDFSSLAGYVSAAVSN